MNPPQLTVPHGQVTFLVQNRSSAPNVTPSVSANPGVAGAASATALNNTSGVSSVSLLPHQHHSVQTYNFYRQGTFTSCPNLITRPGVAPSQFNKASVCDLSLSKRNFSISQFFASPRRCCLRRARKRRSRPDPTPSGMAPGSPAGSYALSGVRYRQPIRWTPERPKCRFFPASVAEKAGYEWR